MKKLFIGDLHGDADFAKFILEKYRNTHELVFIGDYVGSFDFNVEDQVRCINIVLEAVKNFNNVKALLGNHELSYLYPKMKCSGYSEKLQSLINPIKGELIDNLLSFIYYPEYKLLITHAGLTNSIWKEFKLVPNKLKTRLEEWIEDRKSPAYRIGSCRGGRNKAGGIFWNDFVEEFTSVDEIIQVFGHTAYSFVRIEGIRNKGKNYNLDCLRHVYNILEFDPVSREFEEIKTNYK